MPVSLKQGGQAQGCTVKHLVYFRLCRRRHGWVLCHRSQLLLSGHRTRDQGCQQLVTQGLNRTFSLGIPSGETQKVLVIQQWVQSKGEGRRAAMTDLRQLFGPGSKATQAGSFMHRDGRLVLERTGKFVCNTSHVNFNLTVKNF